MKKEIEEIIENLEFLISEDCTDTQFDYVDDIENAIEIIKTIKNAEIDINHLIEICEAEREGRLVVLPCRVKDEVFLIKGGEVHKNSARQWHFTDNLKQAFLSLYDDFCRFEDFGKTVFLTRAEAEKALVEMEENNENNNN